MKGAKPTIRGMMKFVSLAMLLILLTMPVMVSAALTKTTTIVQVDAWQPVVANTLVVGASYDLSTSYSTVVYIELAPVEAVATDGAEIIICVSYGDDNWVQLTTFKATAETAATTTINDAAVNAGDTSLTLTDATTGDFDINGRKWFILDGTYGNSESVRTKGQAANVVTPCQDLLRAHANGLAVYDRVDEWVVSIAMPVAYVRVLINNVDADCDVAFTTRISKVTAL